MFGLLLVGLCSFGLVKQVQQHHRLQAQQLASTRLPPPSSYTPGKIPAQGRLVVVLQGRGTAQTRDFTVPDFWNLYFDFACVESAPTEGFSATLNTTGNRVSPLNQLINSMGGESGNGNRQYRGSGRFHLSVVAGKACSWRFVIKTALQ